MTVEGYIGRIKAYRAKTGCGLKEAKDAVESGADLIDWQARAIGAGAQVAGLTAERDATVKACDEWKARAIKAETELALSFIRGNMLLPTMSAEDNARLCRGDEAADDVASNGTWRSRALTAEGDLSNALDRAASNLARAIAAEAENATLRADNAGLWTLASNYREVPPEANLAVRKAYEDAAQVALEVCNDYLVAESDEIKSAILARADAVCPKGDGT